MSEEDAAAQGLSREELERMDAEAEAEGDEEVGFSLTFRFAASNPFFEEGLEEVTLHCYSHGEIAQVTPEALPWREGMDPTVETKVRREQLSLTQPYPSPRASPSPSPLPKVRRKKRKGSSVSQRVTEEAPRLPLPVLALLPALCWLHASPRCSPPPRLAPPP